MPSTREEKIFCPTTYLKTKSFKTVQAIFPRKFNFNNYPQKSQIYRKVHKLQATGSVNNLNKKPGNPISGRKLIARCPNNVDAVRDSVGRSSKKSLVFPVHRCKNLKEGSSAIPIQNPDQVINHYHINGLHLLWEILYES